MSAAAAAATATPPDDVAIGIDLGTTYSCVAVWRPAQNRVEVLANDQGKRTTPSFVSFTAHDRLVGDAAKSQAHANPANTVFDAKRLLGRTLDDPAVRSDAKHWPFRVRETSPTDPRPLIEVQHKGENATFAPEQISAYVLEHMKRVAEAALGHAVTKAVITVPAYFNDTQRQATKDAGAIAGLDVLRIINEPTAAAIAYGFDVVGGKVPPTPPTSAASSSSSSSSSHHGTSQCAGGVGGAAAPSTVLIFDLGGGTFDVSILTLDNGTFEVLATAGDTHLGGEDFDNNMVDFCVAEFMRKNGAAVAGKKPSDRMLRRLRTACEEAKRMLSSATVAHVELESFLDGRDLSVAVSRARFEEMNAALFRKCIATVRSALQDAKLEPANIDQVVMVGGSSRIPRVREDLKKVFGDATPLNHSINPDEAVAYGAAVQAAALAQRSSASRKGRVDDDLGALVLMDVTPLSLGLETLGGAMTVVIPRNTAIPCSEVRTFSTHQDNQPGVTVQVFEGERALTRDNHLIGKFSLTGIPLRPRGIPKIEVTFSVDVDGILSVTARCTIPGSTTDAAVVADVKIRNERGRVSEADLERMMREAADFLDQDQDVRNRISAHAALEQLVFHTLRVLDARAELAPHLSDAQCAAARRIAVDTDTWLCTDAAEAAAVPVATFEQKHALLVGALPPHPLEEEERGASAGAEGAGTDKGLNTPPPAADAATTAGCAGAPPTLDDSVF